MTGAPREERRAVMTAVNPLRGEFAAILAGERIAFDTTLQSVALIEERCGGVSIVEAINTAVFGRRATDGMALIAGALAARGRADAEALAGRTAAVEAEAFILALMVALGFEVVQRPPGREGGQDPFAATPGPAGRTSGATGGGSPSPP